jgi:hypothetical protein
MAAWPTIAACGHRASRAPQAGFAQVLEYRPVFQDCRRADGAKRLATRRMEIDGQAMILTVDAATLVTHLEPDQDWACTDTDEERQKGTRYLQAVQSSVMPAAGAPGRLPGVIAYGGLLRAATTGSFVTGDLCPSRRPLDRAFLQKLLAVQSPLPLALSISGLWLIWHRADFQWLRDQERADVLRITWVDHSYHHPYVAGHALADNFLLTPGIDMRSEILDTERLLVANHATPSVFFRFPGLMSNQALMQVAGDFHLVVLGAGAWLARTPRARPGDIILVHLNGNEPAGLSIFSDLLARGKLPQPFKPIGEAP